MGLKLKSTGGTGSVELKAPDNHNPDTTITLPADNVTGGEFVLADGSGNVGIGTDSVTAFSDYTTVQIDSGSSGSALRFLDTGDTAGTDDFVIYKNSSGAYLRSYADPIVFYGSSSEYARIDSSGRLLVAAGSALSNVKVTSVSGNTPTVQLQGQNDSYSTSISVTNSSGSSYGPAIALNASKGTQASPAVVSSNGDLGFLTFNGYDGTNYIPGAHIAAFVDGTPGANDMPGRLVFSTNGGTSSPTPRLTIFSSGVFQAPDIYAATTASAANVFISSAGNFARSTSSQKYKTDVETLQNSYADAVLNCRPVWYRSTCEADNSQWGWWGFIAEEVASIDPRLVHWKTTKSVIKEDGSRETVVLDEPEPDGVAYERFVPHLLNLIKRQQQAIETLEATNTAQAATIADLDARLTALEGGTNP